MKCLFNNHPNNKEFKMSKKFSILLMAVLLISVLAACAPVAAPAAQPPIRQINVSGSGKVYVVPDVAYINIGVHTEADTVTEALNQNNQQAQAVADALKAQGVDEKDIQTTAFNVYPQQEYGMDGTIVRRYFSVDNTLYVKVRNLQNLGKLLDTVVRSGANTINGITFDVLNREAAEKEARALAIADARAKAEEIAAEAGLTLGQIQTLNVYASGGAMPYYDAKVGGAMAAPYAEVPMAAGQLVIMADANITYEIK
jgi:uncharacterized protein YggE